MVRCLCSAAALALVVHDFSAESLANGCDDDDDDAAVRAIRAAHMHLLVDRWDHQDAIGVDADEGGCVVGYSVPSIRGGRVVGVAFSGAASMLQCEAPEEADIPADVGCVHSHVCGVVVVVVAVAAAGRFGTKQLLYPVRTGHPANGLPAHVPVAVPDAHFRASHAAKQWPC